MSALPREKELQSLSLVLQEVSMHPVSFIAVAENLTTPRRLRLHIYFREEVTDVEKNKARQQLEATNKAVAPTLETVGVELNLMFPNLRGSTPEQIKHGLDRIYNNSFSGWRLMSFGEVQPIPGREPHITPGNAQAAFSFPRTTPKTC